MEAARVRRLARMLRIGLSDAETEDLAADLAAVLRQVDAAFEGADLRQVEAREPELESSPAAPLPGLRADEPGADPLTRPPESFAPAWRDGWFTIPRVR